MVRKKYSVIQDMLKREKIHYTRQQRQLEEVINEQNKELGKIYINLPTSNIEITQFTLELKMLSNVM